MPKVDFGVSREPLGARYQSRHVSGRLESNLRELILSFWGHIFDHWELPGVYIQPLCAFEAQLGSQFDATGITTQHSSSMRSERRWVCPGRRFVRLGRRCDRGGCVLYFSYCLVAPPEHQTNLPIKLLSHKGGRRVARSANNLMPVEVTTPQAGSAA